MTSQWIFTAIVIAVVIQRVIELRISKANRQYLLARGGVEHGENLLKVVKIMQISWFLCMLTEVWLLKRPFIPYLAIICTLGLILGQTLRLLAMKALGRRWTLPIITVSGMPVVKTGIYRYFRHPNWIGVIFEIVCLPLIHTAYLTAVFFSAANFLVILKRMSFEEQVLNRDNF